VLLIESPPPLPLLRYAPTFLPSRKKMIFFLPRGRSFTLFFDDYNSSGMGWFTFCSLSFMLEFEVFTLLPFSSFSVRLAAFFLFSSPHCDLATVAVDDDAFPEEGTAPPPLCSKSWCWSPFFFLTRLSSFFFPARKFHFPFL